MAEQEAIPLSPRRATEAMLSSTIGCFLLNTAVLILGTTVFFTATMGTWDHLAINLAMGSIIGVPAGLMLSGLMLIPFLTSNAVLAHRNVTRHRRVWLCGPTFVVVAIFLAASFWISLPAQRLEFVAMDDLANASRIRVTGSSGFLASDWVAVCRIDEVSFLSYCRSHRLIMEEKIDVQDKLKKRSLIRSADLVASLPTYIDPIQFSRLEGENQRFGVFALYDRASSTMVIYRYVHD